MDYGEICVSLQPRDCSVTNTLVDAKTYQGPRAPSYSERGKIILIL